MQIDLSEPITTIQNFINQLLGALPQIVLGIIIFTAFFWGASFFRKTVRRLASRNKAHESLGIVLGRLIQMALIAFGTFMAVVIVVPSVKFSALIQLLGISSIAIGFAFKDILQNFLAGILILINQPFRLGDQIRIDAYEGMVEDIQTRATLIRTYDGKRVVVPNSKMFTEAFTVNTAFESRRNEITVGIGYSDDLALAKKLMSEAMDSVSGVLKEPPPDTITANFGPSSIDIRARWWSKPEMAAFLKVQDAVIAEIRKRLSGAGIDLPFPTRQILFHDQTESTDGDRRRQREGWPAGEGDVPGPRHKDLRAPELEKS